eukprot:1920519-Rhodomonas_salina.5
MVNTCPAPRVNSNLLGQVLASSSSFFGGEDLLGCVLNVGNVVCVVGRVKGPAQGGIMYLE